MNDCQNKQERKMKNIKSNYIFNIIWLYFCMYFLNFFNMSNTVVLLIGAGLCAGMVIQQKRIRIDFGICLLSITLVSYYVIVNGLNGITYAILYIPLMIYVLSNYTVCYLKNDKDSNKKIVALLWALVLGFTIYGILNSYMYYAGFVVPGTRRWEDFWSHEIVPGTQHTVYFLPMLATFFSMIVFAKEKKWKCAIVILLTLFFCYTSLVTKSRMPLLIFALTILVQGILYAVLEWQTVKKLLGVKRTWILIGGLIVVTVAAFFVVKDTKIVSIFIANMGKDGGILNNIRFVAQRQAIYQLFDYPMGGRKMTMVLGNFCHNTWLDMANAGGVIPFFSFTAYTIYSLYEVCVLMKQKEISTEIKLMTAGIYGVFFLYFSVEPALDASVHYLTPWIFLNGMVHAINSKKEILKEGDYYV